MHSITLCAPVGRHFLADGTPLFVGRDKYENEDLIKWGWPEDVWFHVDNLSSPHVYVRLPPVRVLSRLLGAVGSLFDFGETASGAVSRAPAVAAASPGSADAPAELFDAAAVTVVTQASGVSEPATAPVVSAVSALDSGATASDLRVLVGTTPVLGARMFHRNAEGKTCFSPAEAAAASAYIRDARVLTQVRSRIRHMAFQLPQQASNISATFCNECVYGRMNLVMVHGLLRLGES